MHVKREITTAVAWLGPFGDLILQEFSVIRLCVDLKRTWSFNGFASPPPYPALSHLHILGLRLFITSLESFYTTVDPKGMDR